MFKHLLKKIIEKKDRLVLKYLLSNKELKHLANQYAELEQQYLSLKKEQENIVARIKGLLEELDYLKVVNNQNNPNEEHY